MTSLYKELIITAVVVFGFLTAEGHVINAIQLKNVQGYKILNALNNARQVGTDFSRTEPRFFIPTAVSLIKGAVLGVKSGVVAAGSLAGAAGLGALAGGLGALALEGTTTTAAPATDAPICIIAPQSQARSLDNAGEEDEEEDDNGTGKFITKTTAPATTSAPTGTTGSAGTTAGSQTGTGTGYATGTQNGSGTGTNAGTGTATGSVSATGTGTNTGTQTATQTITLTGTGGGSSGNVNCVIVTKSRHRKKRSLRSHKELEKQKILDAEKESLSKEPETNTSENKSEQKEPSEKTSTNASMDAVIISDAILNKENPEKKNNSQ